MTKSNNKSSNKPSKLKRAKKILDGARVFGGIPGTALAVLARLFLAKKLTQKMTPAKRAMVRRLLYPAMVFAGVTTRLARAVVKNVDACTKEGIAPALCSKKYVQQFVNLGNKSAIDRAYRQLAIKKHPNKGGNAENFKKFTKRLAKKMLETPGMHLRFTKLNNPIPFYKMQN